MKEQTIKDYLYWCADRYVSYRPRTEFELRRYLTQKLKKKNITDEDEQARFLQTTLRKLAAENRLNDAQFLEWYIDDRQYFRPRGQRRLVNELVRKGISKDLIDAHFSRNAIEEMPLILDILHKKFFLHNSTTTPAFQQKIINHLLRRGFSYSNIKLAFEEFIKKK